MNFPRAGKLEIRATKPMANGRDLSRAYSPGVAEALFGNRKKTQKMLGAIHQEEIWLQLFQTAQLF